MSADTVSVTGWGRTAPTAARLIRPRTYEEAAAAVRDCGARGGIPRGLGRAYGDAAQNAGGAVLDMTGLDRVHAIDADGGTVLCDAGVSLHRLMEVLLPLGWFVPVTPGTRYVTVGGAIGADIHGKNHHVSGSFSRHVLVARTPHRRRRDPHGRPRHAPVRRHGRRHGPDRRDPHRDGPAPAGRDLADVGRHRARAGPRRPDGPSDRHRPPATATRSPGSTCWPAARPPAARCSPGATTPRWTRCRDRTRARRTPLAFRTPRLPAAPALLPDGLLSRTTVGLFNELWYRKAPRARSGELQRISTFFHPLDGVPHWNRIYGRGGFVQYQFVVGYGQEDALRRIVRRISRAPLPVLPRRPQALRGRRPGLALLPRAGLDAGPGHPGGTARPRRPSSTNWTRRSPPPAGASTSPRTPGCGPSCSPRCTRASTTSARCARSWTRAGCSCPTWPAASAL